MASEPCYEITSPLFDRITVSLDARYDAGKTSTITTLGNRPGNTHIQSARLNGRPLTARFRVTHQELTSGGTLDITLGPELNKAWGVVHAR